MGYSLTEAEALSIKDQGERDFALACIEVGCLLYTQIPVGNSRIDFLVVNPKNPSSKGKLVEVTYEKRADIEKKHIKKGKGHQAKKVINTTGMRKLRQIDRMKNSGLPWTILCGEEMENLKRTR